MERENGEESIEAADRWLEFSKFLSTIHLMDRALNNRSEKD